MCLMIAILTKKKLFIILLLANKTKKEYKNLVYVYNLFAYTFIILCIPWSEIADTKNWKRFLFSNLVGNRKFFKFFHLLTADTDVHMRQRTIELARLTGPVDKYEPGFRRRDFIFSLLISREKLQIPGYFRKIPAFSRF